MGFFDFLKSKQSDPDPTLTVESSNSKPETKNRRGGGPGREADTESQNLEIELQQRQDAYNDYRNQMLSGELGSSFGSGQGEEQLNELSRLDDLVKETQAKIDGRDERNLGLAAGLGALSGLSSITAGELMAQSSPGGSGQVGGNQAKSGSGANQPETLPPQIFSEDNTPYQPIDDPIDNLPAPPMPTTSTDLGKSTPSLVGGQSLSGVGDTFGGKSREDKGSILDRIGERVGQMAGEMAGVPLEDFERDSGGTLRRNERPSPTQGPSATIQDITDQSHQTDTIIFRESERNHPNEHTVFQSALSGLSIALVEYIKKVDPNIEIAVDFMERVGFNLPQVISGASQNVVSQISQISHMDTASMRGSKNNRVKLRLQDQEHKMLKNAVFYPFIIIAIKFYSITKQINFDLNYFTGVALSQILKTYLKLPPANVDYAISLLQNFPLELGEAYFNNRNEVVGITKNQSIEIQKYIELIKNEYKNYFNEDYMTSVKKTEYGSSTLPEVLNHLNNPRMLNVVFSVMMTIDNFILSVQNNDNVLLGLMGLVYAEASNNGDLVDANIISNSNVLGYVYFEGSMPMIGKKNIELEALKQMSKPKDQRRLNGLKLIENNEKVSLWEDNMGNALVTIRGTDHKDNQDLMDNFLNFGGTVEAYKTKRHNVARRLINKKQRQISNTGRGSLKILGFSLGAATAMRLSLEFPHLKIKAYNPIVSNSELQKNLFKDLKDKKSNIEFFYVDEDPISVNLKEYKDFFKMTMVKKNKFFTSHSLNNYG